MKISDDIARFALAMRPVVLPFALLALSTTAAHAQVTDGWRFEAMPYLGPPA